MAKIDFRFDLAFFVGCHESDLHPHYKRLLKPGMRCFDVGMWRGWDALLLGHLTGGDVVSFGVNPKNLEGTEDLLSPSALKVRLVRAYVNDGSEGGMTLEQAARDYFVPDFIKIDVEGAEASVLRGAKSILSDRQPPLIVETHGGAVESECVAILERCGYRPVVVERSRRISSESRSVEHNRWLVCEGRLGT